MMNMKLLEQVEKGYKMPCINNSDPHIKFQIPISEFRIQFAILNFEFYFCFCSIGIINMEL